MLAFKSFKTSEEFEKWQKENTFEAKRIIHVSPVGLDFSGTTKEDPIQGSNVTFDMNKLDYGLFIIYHKNEEDKVDA